MVMSQDDYLTKVMNQLNNTQFYEKLSDDPMERLSEEITFLLKEMKKEGIGIRNLLFPPTSECQDILVLHLTKNT